MDEERRKETHVHWIPCLCSAGVLGVAAGMEQDRCSWSSGWSHTSAALCRGDGVNEGRAVCAEVWVWSTSYSCCRSTPARSQRKEIGLSLEGQWRGVSAVESYSELRKWDLGYTFKIQYVLASAHIPVVELWWIFALWFISSTGFSRTSAASIMPLVVTYNSRGNTLLLSDILVCCVCLLEPYT